MTGAVRALLRRLDRLLPAAAGGVSVLAYHLVGAGTASPVDLDRDHFRRHLDELAASGRVVPLERALERLRAGDGGRHRIVLTFDDAFRNFLEVAWPELRRRALPATLYAPVGFVDGGSEAPLAGAERLPPMRWDELRELASSELVEVGSHGLAHTDLRALSDDDCRRELGESRRVLEERLSTPVTSFCYPRGLWSRRVRDLAAAVYASAVAAGGRRNRGSDCDPYRISRLPVRRRPELPLAELLRAPVWLEEWAADLWRRRLG